MLTASEVADRLRGYRYRFHDELRLQDGLARVLLTEGIPFEREHRLSPKQRVDFFVDGRIALEVKIEGGLAAITSQLFGYATCEAVESLILVSRKMQHAHVFERELAGKRLVVVTLEGSSL